jgi:hypothetical protein
MHYIINYTLFKIINNFDFFNKTSGQNCVIKLNFKYLGMEGVGKNDCFILFFAQNFIINDVVFTYFYYKVRFKKN